MESRSKEKTMEWKESQDGEMEKWKDGREGREKMKITHLEQSLLNYSPHILPPLGYVGVELVQIRGER